MKTIKIMGQEVKVAFNLAVQVAYEDITGEAFDLSMMTTRKKTLALDMAAIIANNPDTELTMEMMMNVMSYDEMMSLEGALREEIAAWYHVSPVGKKPEEGGRKKKHAERP